MSESGNKKSVIWSTVSSLSCFWWLYKAFPSLAAMNIMSLILVLTICWCPCVESSLVLLVEGVYYDQCVLLAKLCLPLACFILCTKAKFVCYFSFLLTSYFCIPVPYNEKDIFWGVLFLPFNISFFNITGWDIGLDYCDIEWFALETNREYSAIFEIAPK